MKARHMNLWTRLENIVNLFPAYEIELLETFIYGTFTLKVCHDDNSFPFTL